MAKITDMDPIAAEDVADDDLFVIVDISDPTTAPTGTDKNITRAEMGKLFGPRNVRHVTTNTAATTGDYVILADTTIDILHVNLPPAGDPGVEGLILIIKKITADVNNVIIDPDSSEQIEGSITLILTSEGDAAMIQSDGVDWWLI